MSVLRLVRLSGREDGFVFSEDGGGSVERLLLLLVFLLIDFRENFVI